MTITKEETKNFDIEVTRRENEYTKEIDFRLRSKEKISPNIMAINIRKRKEKSFGFDPDEDPILINISTTGDITEDEANDFANYIKQATVEAQILRAEEREEK